MSASQYVQLTLDLSNAPTVLVSGPGADISLTTGAPKVSVSADLPSVGIGVPGQRGATGVAGPQGPQGFQGVQGLQGPAGPLPPTIELTQAEYDALVVKDADTLYIITDAADRTVLSGTVPASSTNGIDGDFWIDSNLWKVQGPKSGSWPAAVSMIGPAGATGSAGTNGATGATGLPGITRVNHGAVAGTARPATADVVLWVGSVTPTNANTSKDLFAQTP